VTIVVELLAIVALLCAAVVAVTTWHLPRSVTVAMVLGAGAMALGCIVVPSPTQKWQSGARWRRVVGHRVAVVVCGVELLGTGIDAADEETRRQRWELLATAAAVFVAVWVVRFRLRHDVSVCNGMDSSLSWVL
jgi:hypothetical protein